MTERDPNRLPTTVVPSHYDLRLAPDLDAATFTGTTVATIDVLEDTDEIVLHALDLEIHEAWLAQGNERLDVTVTFEPATETAVLRPPSTIEAGAWTLHTTFTGELNDKLVGFYRSTFTDADGETRTIACTQFESTHARRAFPCWDEPAFKATYAVTLDVPSDLFAVSNAAEIERTTIGDGLDRVRYATTMKMSTYLVAFVVGPLEATDPVDVDGVPLRVITPVGQRHLTDFALEVGAFSLRYLADWYAIPYPGDKVDLIAVPDFSFGAMENLGCITFRETALLLDRDRSTQAEQLRVADVIAHELAHMWFGDLVTMGWWEGIWLNEAFATFMEMMTTDAYRPDWQRWVEFGLARSMAFDTDSLSTTRPIEYEVVTAEDAEGMFDVLTYEKGSSVVRMLQQYLGEERFQAGIRRYLAAHAYGNTVTTDLWDAIEEASGEPVRRTMDTWIYRPGHPVVSVSRVADDMLVLRQQRFGFLADPAAGVTVPTETDRVIPVVLRLGSASGARVERVLLDRAEQHVRLTEPVDWVVGNHEGNGFYRSELGDDDLAALSSVALRELSPLERYGLVEDEWALVLAGRSDVARVLDLIRALSADDDLSVWQRIVGVLGSISRHGGDEARPALEAWSRAVIAPALVRLGAEPVEGESDRTAALRATLAVALAAIGADERQRELARDRFDALGANAGAVSPDLADAAVRVVAEDADEATWDELRRRALAATTAQDRLRHHGALAEGRDPALVLRFCDLVFTDEIRTQDGLFLLRRALANRNAAGDVWALIEDRWDDITGRFPSASLPRLLDGIRGIGDRALAERVAAFLDAHPVAQGVQVVAQHRERMWVSVALAERLPAQLAVALR